MKPKLLWLVGIEGSGHHLVRDLLHDFLVSPQVVDKGGYYPLWVQRWDDQQKPLPQPAVRELNKAILEDYQARQCTHVYEDTSFPFGGVGPDLSKYVSSETYRGPGRHPRINDLLELLDELVDFRILVLYRSPLATVRSTLRRGFSNDLEFECQLAKSIHSYLSQELRRLPAGLYRTCHYVDWLANPEALAQSLADWWEIEPGLIDKGLSRIRPPSLDDPLSPEQAAFLAEYFPEACLAPWLDAYQANPLVCP